jgi:putative ABC transport system substrate-binding protein
MRRREFITLLSGTAAAWPFAARAQQGARPVVGILASGTPSGLWAELFAAFRQGLGETGYSEGGNVTIEARWAEDQYDRLPALAAELVAHRPTLIAAFATPAARAAKTATTTIPVVFVTIADPVQIGLVASLNHPGGNLTGMSLLGVEIGPKLLELLHEAVPSASIMALLVNPTNPNAAIQSKTLLTAAQRLGLQLHVLDASTPGDFETVFAKSHELGVAALTIGQDILFTGATEHLAKLAGSYKIPAIYVQREFARGGWTDELRRQPARRISAGGHLRWTNPQGREARRLAGDAGHQVRFGDQSKDR